MPLNVCPSAILNSLISFDVKLQIIKGRPLEPVTLIFILLPSFRFSLPIILYFAFGNKPILIRKEFYYPLLLASLLQYLLIICDAMGFDLLSMRTQLEESSHFAYLGTLGNSNWIVGYLSLMLPLQICFYLSAKNRYKTCFAFVLSLSGLLASILIGADGMFISMGIYLFLLTPMIMENVERIKRFLMGI